MGNIGVGNVPTNCPWVVCDAIAFEPATAELFGNVQHPHVEIASKDLDVMISNKGRGFIPYPRVFCLPSYLHCHVMAMKAENGNLLSKMTNGLTKGRPDDKHPCLGNSTLFTANLCMEQDEAFEQSFAYRDDNCVTAFGNANNMILPCLSVRQLYAATVIQLRLLRPRHSWGLEHICHIYVALQANCYAPSISCVMIIHHLSNCDFVSIVIVAVN